ncbi:MAG TPA: hypothetical protein VMW69_09760 [Spirochaetia bacterium]|nr:hypothetical protein [Spirochaetia bacterium]
MKRIIGLAGLLIGSLTLFSCYIMPVQSTGSVNISVPSVAPRTIANGTTSVGDYIRIYLYTYAVKGDDTHYTLYKFPDGNTYKDFPNAVGQTNTLTLDKIPSGLWQVLISTGSVDTSTGFMNVKYYGSSGVFNLVPGTENAVPSFAINPTPFTANPDLLDKNVVGVRQIVGLSSVYAATSDTLYRGSAGDQSLIANAGSMTTDPNSSAITAGGNSIESLSNGFIYSATNALFVNTSLKRIIPYDGISAPDTGFSANLAPTISSVTGLTSGAFTVPGTTPIVVIFYQRDGGLGGADLTATGAPAAADWIDFPTSGIVSGQPVYSFVMHGGVTNPFAYVATKLGAFRLSETSFQSGSTSSDILNVGKTFAAAPDTVIQALAIDDSTSTPTLYMGTNNGVYTATLQESDANNPIGAATLLSGTLGDSFSRVAINANGDVAMRSKYNLYIIQKDGTKSTYPFYSGLPGELNSMTWGNGSADKTLYVGGANGLAAIAVTN